ncbi:hypothetical protein T06_13687 [Trichinella sp. T6]|nr:hypothetical protein T06_13687 [Trichinella sp. T6]
MFPIPKFNHPGSQFITKRAKFLKKAHFRKLQKQQRL